jgi:hypothetical protein
MAMFDHGGGCPCGLYRQCTPDCESNAANKLSSWQATAALQAMLRLPKRDKLRVLRRLEELMTKKEAA